MPDDNPNTSTSRAVARPFDRNTLATTMQTGGPAAVFFAPTDFLGLLEVANLMSASGPAVPKHCRGNPGICLSIAMTGYQNGFIPFLLAGDTFVVNDILAYGAKSIAAMVNNSPRLEERLDPVLSGEWPKRICTVTGKIRGQKPKSLEIKAETITTRNSPLWKQQPDQQLIYYSQRAWARVYMPEILLGLMDRDEAAEVGPDHARDITPEKPRPSRSDFTDQPQGPPVTDVELEPEPEPEPQPEPYAFISVDGEEIECADGSAWGNRLYAALQEATTADFVEGLWDTNSPQLQRLRDEDDDGVKLAEHIEKTYGEMAAKLRAAKVQQQTEHPAQAQTGQQPQQQTGQGAGQEPKDTRPNAPRHLGKVPKDSRTGTFDWPKAMQVLGDHIEKSDTPEDVRAWQELHMQWIETGAKNAPDAYRALQARIQGTLTWINEGKPE